MSETFPGTRLKLTDLAGILANHPTCNARCADEQGVHATLIHVGVQHGTDRPNEHELTASFVMQCEGLGTRYLDHEPAHEAPPPDDSWSGTAYKIARITEDTSLGLLRNQMTAGEARGEFGKFESYLVRWFVPVTLIPLRAHFYRQEPEQARALGVQEGGR